MSLQVPSYEEYLELEVKYIMFGAKIATIESLLTKHEGVHEQVMSEIAKFGAEIRELKMVVEEHYHEHDHKDIRDTIDILITKVDEITKSDAP